MPSPVEPFASTGVVREAIDPRRFSWIRPLTSDYADRFDALAALFAGNPADPAAWRATLARITARRRDRTAMPAALARQLERRGAPAEARQAAAELAQPTTVAILTGQQAGLFGGPLYTLLKAVTTVQLARHVRASYGVPAVPVFWVDTEDHDWAEVKSAHVLDRDGNVAHVTAADVAGAGRLPIASLSLEASSTVALDQLAELLPPTEFTGDVLAALRRRYQAGTGVGSACAGWIEDLLGRHGLVVFEADDPSVKPLAADLFARELSARRTAPLAREAGAMMARLGHTAQVEPAEDSVALFYLNGTARLPIRARGDQFQIGDDVRPCADVEAEARQHPERFSPNVLLRPLVQDRLFPTACYVAGPAELAYQAQLGGVYREYDVDAPLLYSRVSATLIDAGAVRFFERSGLPLEALQPQDDSALNQLLARELPPGLDRAIDETDQLIRDRVAALKAAVVSVDPTLSGTVDTTVDRMRETMKGLHGKVVQAAKRKDDTLRRQFVRTRSLAFPEGQPQERYLSLAFFVNRYGLALGDRLLETLPLATDKHYVLAL